MAAVHARALVVLAVGLGSASCLSLSSGARNIFSKQISCPPDRVTVVARPDLPPHSIYEGVVDAPPPADIAADPARLRYFRQQQAEKVSNIDESCKMYEVTGCGAHRLTCCNHWEDSTNPSGVTCFDGTQSGISTAFDP